MSDDIDKLLEQARTRAANYGKLFGAKETADDYLKTAYAMLWADAPEGRLDDKDAWVRRHPNYVAALDRKENVCAEWKTAETYMRLLLVEAEVWRTKQANNRLMDGAHR